MKKIRTTLTVKDAVKRLSLVNTDDPEQAHSMADQILLYSAPEEVRKAYEELRERCSFWAYA